ncbi:MAG: DHH family phosphoesterase, partial [Firmicutes bacterium]|nr:DHH family phosphoesterase [Bacillota bacterium]
MKEKYVKRPILNYDCVEFLESKGFPTEYAEALAARNVGKDNFDSIFGNESVFHSPFDMVNMREAVETVSYVLETGGSILIYGDYDADGLTASSLLSLFFSDNGIENTVLIPTRDEGYGLHADKVIRAFKRNYYDLIITVDCGISNAEEVKKITEELGVEVIVTDHHELPDTLPDCICVNPKLGYPFPYLSGAGVAWKLVEAIAGRDVATNYACLAAIGTIGDIMPMSDE